MKRAVCLLSGGMDSAVSTATAKTQGYTVYALTFDYGQRHRKEIECARRLAGFFKVKEHKTLKIDLGEFGGSALTDNIKVPTGKTIGEIKKSGLIPETYVPARNTIMLSFALAYAEVKEADAIYIGANSVDYSGYPDCRPEYFKRFQKLADIATKKGLTGGGARIKTPLLYMTKADIIKRGIELEVPFQYTWSCYMGGMKACGGCDSCVLRLNGFKEAGLKDPLAYETK
ncbi:MAG: 7-cyano-7-deazaguanine synthase QueC [Candidatus Altiarchaeota archaeon]|nr:7-cyano-7-deazaguanine synthase QueC [Candidatus Altiarchaeota archaeon]